MHRLVTMSVMALAVLATGGCEPPAVHIRPAEVKVAKETVGTGLEARPGRVVTIDYRLTLPDGSELLKQERFAFTLGGGGVIECVDSAVQGMRIGGTRTVTCPPNRHWGSKGYGDKVPPNTTLTLEVRLVSVQ